MSYDLADFHRNRGFGPRACYEDSAEDHMAVQDTLAEAVAWTTDALHERMRNIVSEHNGATRAHDQFTATHLHNVTGRSPVEKYSPPISHFSTEATSINVHRSAYHLVNGPPE